MTILTLDAMLAGAQPLQYFCKPSNNVSRIQSTWGQAGIPGAGSYNTTLNGGTYSSTSALVAGQIPHYDPGGALQSNLARFNISPHANGGGWALVCDRLWDNGGINITSTSLQSITSPAFPVRDNGGSTVPHGPLLALEVSAATGAGTPTITVGYTNTSGTASRTSTNVLATVASVPTGTVFLLSLQSGDTGVQSVQSITLSATWTSGTINLVAYEPLCSTIFLANSASVDSITGCFPRLYNGVVPYLMYKTSIGTNLIHGCYIEAQG